MTDTDCAICGRPMGAHPCAFNVAKGNLNPGGVISGPQPAVFDKRDFPLVTRNERAIAVETGARALASSPDQWVLREGTTEAIAALVLDSAHSHGCFTYNESDSDA